MTDRDKRIENFLKKFKVARTSTLYELFFKGVSMRYCYKRLQELSEDKRKILQRDREHIDWEYYYWIPKHKPKESHLRHRLLVTDFYREMSKLPLTIDKFKNELNIEDLRCDGLIQYIDSRGDKYVNFLEVDISNTKIDKVIEKYIKLYRSGNYHIGDTFPRLILVTDKKVPEVKQFGVIKIKEDLSNIENIL